MDEKNLKKFVLSVSFSVANAQLDEFISVYKKNLAARSKDSPKVINMCVLV